MPFDLSMWKLLVLGLIAIVVFGPDRLPEIAKDAARTIRQLRGMAQAARNDLKAELGDTVGDFDLADLNPRTFVRKHLLDDTGPTASAADSSASHAAAVAASIANSAGQPTPYDLDAT